MTLIEITVYLITRNPGHTYCFKHSSPHFELNDSVTSAVLVFIGTGLLEQSL